MPQADWPPGIKNATYGNWYAYRWGQTAKRSGAYGVMLSDFSDSQPAWPSYQIGFNAQLIAGFQARLGRVIPGNGVPARAKFINEHDYPQWNDYLAQGATLTSMPTWPTPRRRPPAIPAWSSINAVNGRAQGSGCRWHRWPISSPTTMPSANYICIWDDQTMQLGRNGQPLIGGIGGMVNAAAREPALRNGGNLSANDSNFWQAAAHFWGNLSYADQQERGLKELKRAWLETAWSHIATRQGTVRRALAFMQRDYWDQGTLDPTVDRLIHGIVPIRPFGYALYYSMAAERNVEATVPARGGANATYMHPNRLLAFKQAGGAGFGYYVSSGWAAVPETGRTAGGMAAARRSCAGRRDGAATQDRAGADIRGAGQALRPRAAGLFRTSVWHRFLRPAR